MPTNLIDLRSDTLTKPTAAMRQAMLEAVVGDDVYDEDPTVVAFQDRVAAMFGMEAGLFCPSGTMTNQIAIKLLTQPQDEVICYKDAHIYKYEAGGLAFNALISNKLVDAPRGLLTVAQLRPALNPDDIHYPVSRLVALENTVNRGGGSCYRLSDIAPIADFCQEQGLGLHLDGARLFNALIATGDKAADYGQYFDTISICFSKSLGCPVGSVLLGPAAAMQRAKRLRKVLGGGMRQAGFLAAAGLYALDHHIDRLADDHRRAKLIGQALEAVPAITELLPVETNIVIAYFEHEAAAANFYNYLAQAGAKVGRIGADAVRMVTHLDFDDLQLERLMTLIRQYKG
ncbi:threonine aldolase family protein [Eisenibacter elegans]|uniref:threonine aldolase family protein n=1 Tax=Eisenibacter elegans TaxID=997 RepID=UPI00047EAB66|nr:GntG family PLP-dependent aldolase [Eisenibacter elegans]